MVTNEERHRNIEHEFHMIEKEILALKKELRNHINNLNAHKIIMR